MQYEQRKMMLESIQFVDFVIPENEWEQKVKNVKEYNVDTFLIGSWLGRWVWFP